METRSQPAPSARNIALEALCDRDGNVTAHLNRLLGQASLVPAEAGLARELTLGALRRRGTLQALARAFFQPRPGQQKLTARVRNVLDLGIYQLVFLERVPAFAAVNEAVNQVGDRYAFLRGMVNGVLRNIARSLGPVEAGPPPRAREVIPLGPGQFRRMDRPVFPDPREHPAVWLAEACSLPQELAGKWLKQFGRLERALPVALHANLRPPLVLRVNALKATVPEVLARLSAAGVAARAHRNGLSIVLDEYLDVTRLEAFKAGMVRPQDASATAVGILAGPKPGMRVLDLCAAPGTKTMHLAELMRNEGQIVAVDVSPEKLAKVEESARRMGVTIMQPMLAPRVSALEEASFDVVLVDAPCSNTGVLARRPEARWRYSLRAVQTLAGDQLHLLHLGARFVKPGGRCVYSTCSMEEEENRRVVQDFLREPGNLRLAAQHVVMPSGGDDAAEWNDGGFRAVLERVR